MKARLFIGLVVFLSCLAVQSARAQNPTSTPASAGGDDDVIHVNSDLVQTDVTVLDKQGHFVDGIKPEQLQLKINGQVRPIPFFERIAAGSVLDTSGGKASNAAIGTTAGFGSQTGRGRTIIFFVDDAHLSTASLQATRRSLLDFINNKMIDNDQVAITSTSGQVGFLQQFTDDRFVLREAVAKLSYKPGRVNDVEQPPMSEYMAAQIQNGDKQTLEFFVAKLLQDNTVKANSEVIHFVDPEGARTMIMNRAREISMQAGPATDDTLRMLEGLMRTASQIPGRKLVFVISDGFLLVDRQGASPEGIHRITDAAGRAGVVIYTIDARGLVNTNLDATSDRFMDVNNLLSMSSIGELEASQDGLNALARDTGGKPFRNTNAPMSEIVNQVLHETSVYYLLAWQPAADEEKDRKFKKIEVSVIDRPELTVRVRNGYYRTEPIALKLYGKKSKDPVKAREDEIRTMIDAALPQQQIPTKLGVEVIPVLTNSSRITASIRVDRASLIFDGMPPNVAADMDIGAIFYNQKGKPVDSVVGKIRVLPLTAEASERERAGTIFVHDTWLAPGLYQVRVAVRDTKSGRIGTASQWIQVNKL